MKSLTATSMTSFEGILDVLHFVLHNTLKYRKITIIFDS